MVRIDEKLCIGCGACIRDCVGNNIELAEGKATIKNECFLCGHCVAICPSNAVAISEYDMNEVEEYDEASFSVAPDNMLHKIKFRRSIRNYKNDMVTQEVLNQLLNAGRFTATAKNNQSCYFVFVQKEREVFKDLVWSEIDKIKAPEGERLPNDVFPLVAFNRRRKDNPADDFLFRNAPVILFITSDWPLDAGLAAQNIEHMAVSMGLGALYNGYLTRFCDSNEEVKKWLGIEGQTIRGCMLLGYPKTHYFRTAPRKEANVIWK